jgi:phytoene synthase
MSVAGGPLTHRVSLAQSRAYCERVTKAFAKNFYYGLKLLPEPKRSAMYALYAWMRLVDDIADQEDGRAREQRVAELEAWRADTHAVLRDGPDAANGQEVWPAFHEMVSRHGVPAKVFDAVIAGQEQDLDPISFETFDELREYCYRVAGVVGLGSIFVWGFDGDAYTEELAVDRGLAFQLTNILRDLKEDAARGRTYLPKSELRSAGVSEEDVRTGRGGEKFLELMRFQIGRAEEYYQRSKPLEHRISADSRPTLVAMTEIYHSLLKKVARRPQRVLFERVSLSAWSKLRIGWRALRSRS